MAKLVDGTVSRASSLLDAATNDPQRFEKQIRLLGKQSAAFIKKQKLALEIRILKLRLQDVERRIETGLGKDVEENIRL